MVVRVIATFSLTIFDDGRGASSIGNRGKMYWLHVRWHTRR